MNIVLSRHAVEQYRDRVKPGLDLSVCHAELTMLASLGTIQAEEPWRRWPGDVEPKPELHPPDGYMELAPGIWGSLVCEENTWTMRTVLTTAGISSPRRKQRNEAKVKMRQARDRHRKSYVFKRGKRCNRLEDWA